MLTAFIFTLLACTKTDDGACVDDSGVEHAADASWVCDGGCNGSCCTYCNCVDGTVMSYTPECSSDSETCTDATGTYEVGETWTCPDGCNTCSCEGDGEICADVRHSARVGAG